MTKDDALRMMLGPFKAWRDVPGNEDVVEELTKIINAVEKVLAHPEQEHVAILNHAHGVYTFRNVNVKGLPDGEYLVYTFPPQRTEPTCPECKAEVLYECVACSSNNYPPKD